MAQPAEAVTVSEAGIKRRLRVSVTNSCAVLRVRAQGGAGDLVAAVATAINRANRSAVNAESQLVAGSHAYKSSKTDVMFYLESDGTLDDVYNWLSAVCDALSRDGWRGTVIAPPNSWGPEAAWRFRDGYIPWQARLGLTQTRRVNTIYAEGGRWAVAEEVTHKAIDFARDWVIQSPGDCYFGGGASQVKVSDLPPTDFLVAELKRNRQMHVSTLGSKPFAKRYVSFSYGGQVTFSLGAVEEHWRDSVAAVRAALIELGTAADCGWVASGTDSFAHGRKTFTGGRQLQQSEWENNRHLWDRYAPDAFGIQILTRTHLARAHELRDWNITPLGNDRFLVEASRLEPWCSQLAPWGSTRSFASHDFGAMILTEAEVLNEEHGWVTGQGRKDTVFL